MAIEPRFFGRFATACSYSHAYATQHFCMADSIVNSPTSVLQKQDWHSRCDS